MVGEGIRWDRFLPRRSLRVLLVENDDSTRHVVAALLRKCSYFVAPVADGVKAWEVLKQKQYKFDLVLSEVDMPSLSGIDFLSKVTASDLSKDIPVIMMSSQDSVNVVFKCMLQGAVDFLVKPVRKNELQNLWQHVWRKRKHCSSNCNNLIEGIDDSHAKSPVTTAEYVFVDHEDEESASKSKDNGADVVDIQSSGSKLDIGARYGLKPLQLPATETNNFSNELAKDVVTRPKLNNIVQECAPRENCPGVGDFNKSSHRNTTSSFKEEIAGSLRSSKPSRFVPSTCSVQIIDFIGAISGGHEPAALEKDACGIEKDIVTGSLQSEEISSRRQCFTGIPKKVFTETHILKPSAASAFSRYSKGISNAQWNSGASPANLCTSPNERTIITIPFASPNKENLPSFSAWHSAPSEEHGTGEWRNGWVISASVIDDDNTEACPPGQVSSLGHFNSPREQHTSHYSPKEANQNGITFNPGQHELVTFPFPTGTMPIQSLYAGYSAVYQPLLYSEAAPSGPIPVQSMKEVISSDGQSHQGHPSFGLPSQENCNTYSVEHERAGGTVAREQGESEACMHTEMEPMDQHNRRNMKLLFGDGDNTMGIDITDYHCNLVMSTHRGDEGRFQAISGHILEHGKSHREAALMKFRLKRKDRCFEKKVRYHSRKMLAEQRPRIKGQFVRQSTVQPTIMITGEDE